MKQFPRPRIIASRCFEFDACRYNGQLIPNNFVAALTPYVDFVPVCPELEIGLGVPRDPIRIISGSGGRRLVQPSTGKDITGAMNSFADGFLGRLADADGFILKSRSPSCGLKDAREFPDAENEIASGKGAGLFAAKVLEKFPHLPAEDEGRLLNFRVRESFLTRVYALARFREVRKGGTMRALVEFQAENKLLLMTHNQNEMRALGRIVANSRRLTVERVIEEYGARLARALSPLPRRAANVNVLMHALGYFSDKLTSKEKAYFLSLLDDFKLERIPLSAVVAVLGSWIVKYGEEYLEAQTYFRPYPPGLMELGDSGKGRDM
jgi:uncharacterized protein YbgA (DUF1722 family)/uncharacterized protein YbbK (DUF523 family)